MAAPDLQRILINAGLDEKGAAVYLAALRLGCCTVLQLAKASGVKRTTVYPVVQGLKQLGLMVVEVKGFKSYLRAAHPQHLDNLVEQRRTALKGAFSELMTLFNLEGSQGSIRCFEGKAAIKECYEELLERLGPSGFYWAISDQESWQALDPEYFEHYKQRRAKIGADVRLLLQVSENARRNVRLRANYREEVRLLPPQVRLQTNTVVVPSCVVLHQLVAPVMAIMIDNPSMVRAQRQQFEIIWENTR